MWVDYRTNIKLIVLQRNRLGKLTHHYILKCNNIYKTHRVSHLRVWTHECRISNNYLYI